MVQRHPFEDCGKPLGMLECDTGLVVVERLFLLFLIKWLHAYQVLLPMSSVWPSNFKSSSLHQNEINDKNIDETEWRPSFEKTKINQSFRFKGGLCHVLH